jgi:hypothetical protein
MMQRLSAAGDGQRWAAKSKSESEMKKLLQGEKLEKRARELGVDIQGEPRTQSSSGREPRATDYELQRRVWDAERAVRESRLWILAVISSIASVLSAAAAIIAILR